MVNDGEKVFREREREKKKWNISAILLLTFYEYQMQFSKYSCTIVCLDPRDESEPNRDDQVKSNVFCMTKLSTRKSINQPESESVS